ncbi:hypothetical protein EYZ11_009097 [Aspergillus tanneri]|uniref:Uncharacterized protein n=1 Tax=Aspergillus tanneri TaxID=1220188 RepID=A0A4S3J8W9_9EURO|nr:uncharacterized protein ATNIH1004_006947 [Aspergillus tanneri]KAA8645528.1 hypothetical protein ATNIH1004_006947 [Aspergillus tanneri]THC91430.1 hypothetical protein EYZ11_009097 [Aspergillus tanneri]
MLTLRDTESIPVDLQTKFQLLDFAKKFVSCITWPTSQRVSDIQPLLGKKDVNKAKDPTAFEKRAPLLQPEAQRPNARIKADNDCRDHNQIPLSDLVVQFISLCNAVDTVVTEKQRAGIAAQLIVQAALQESQVFGNASPESTREYIPKVVAKLDTPPTQDRVKSGGFTSYLQLPPMGISLAAHIEALSERTPLRYLNDAMFDLLTRIIKSLEPPVLVQLERGRLAGLSRAETQQLKDKVGF